jgi:outer membrane receptor protein involved in Fe transport
MGILGDFTTRLLVLVDGHSLMNGVGIDLGRGLPVPLAAIERVEVIKGPVGSVYGPSAFFGVVNLVTAGAPAGAEVWIGGEAAQGRLSAGEASATWQTRGEDRELLLAAAGTTRRGLDYDFPEVAGLAPGVDGRLRRMDFADAGQGYARLRWGGVAASASCGHSFGGMQPSTLVTDHASVLEGLTCFVDAGWRGRIAPGLTLRTRLALDDMEKRAAIGFLDPPLGIGLYQHVGYDRSLTAEARVEWEPGARLRLDLGLTGQGHRVNQHSFAAPGTGLDITHQKDHATLNTWLLAEAEVAPSLALHGGLTLFAHSVFGTRLTPKVAAVWQAGPRDTLKAIWSTGFRPPTIVEALFQDQLAFLDNPDLRPETVHSAELVYEHRFGDVASLSASAFWNQYRDLIRFAVVPAPGLGRPPDPQNPGDFRQQAQNLGSLRLLGAELAARVRLGDWLQAYGGVGAQRSDEADRPNFPALTAKAALSSRALWRPLLLSVQGSFISRRDKPTLGGPAGSVPEVLSLGALLALDIPGVPGLRAELGVQNLLDRRNASPSSVDSAPFTDRPEPARTFRADLRWHD